MNKLIRKFKIREILLFGLTILVAVCGLAARHYIVPAYDRWQALRSLVHVRAIEHAKLTANLAVRESVNRQFESLGPKVRQTNSDQITLSEYLRDLETLARHPSMTLINMKPLPVEQEETHKIYRVKLSVAGKLPEILQFISDVTNGPTITGLKTFTLRGVQGSNMVECSLSLWMIRLIPERNDVAKHNRHKQQYAK